MPTIPATFPVSEVPAGVVPFQVIERREVPAITPERLAQVQAQFTGEIVQVPPMHSALKKDGKALYDYARAGIELERAPRRTTIHRIDVLAWQGNELTLDVSCSKGTYIRTLADDIGQALGCGAHLAALRRSGAGKPQTQDDGNNDASHHVTLVGTGLVFSLRV